VLPGAATGQFTQRAEPFQTRCDKDLPALFLSVHLPFALVQGYLPH
jgi:hypothetical protein